MPQNGENRGSRGLPAVEKPILLAVELKNTGHSIRRAPKKAYFLRCLRFCARNWPRLS